MNFPMFDIVSKTGWKTKTGKWMKLCNVIKVIKVTKNLLIIGHCHQFRRNVNDLKTNKISKSPRNHCQVKVSRALSRPVQ